MSEPAWMSFSRYHTARNDDGEWVVRSIEQGEMGNFKDDYAAALRFADELNHEEHEAIIS